MSSAPPPSDLVKAHRRSQHGFYAALATGSPGARLARWPGVQATVVPVRPWFSIFNGVLFDDAEALRAALPQLVQTYRDAGIGAWRFWVAPEQQAAAEILAAGGHARADVAPQRMAARISDLDLDLHDELDLDPQPTWEAVARCNDRAYGVLEEWSIAAAFATMDDPRTHLYAARKSGVVVSALLAREEAGDCYFWLVATVPEERGKGLASAVMRHALRQARERGCVTTSLEATAMGEAAYARLGFRRLGRFAVFEPELAVS